jgi:tRNA-(ms[2]io[6]A)-hydroxylase
MSAGLPAASQSSRADWSLRWRTPPAWATLMLPHLGELLVEQAHLEKKAAAAAVSFLFRLPTEASHRELSALAREELLHFERTLRLLQGRGIHFRPQAPCDYAARLKRVVAADLPGRLLDELLVSAVIEARSHERMALLGAAVAATDPELAAFYRDLCAAEARHGPAYVSAATASFGPDAVATRWEVVVEHEAAVLAALPWSPRLHGGMAAAEAAS